MFCIRTDLPIQLSALAHWLLLPLLALGLAAPTWADSPPAGQNQTVTAAKNQPVAITLTAYDPNGETDTYTVIAVSGPAHGTLSGTAPNLTYTPTTGFLGTDSFQYQVSDSTGGTSTPATITIAVENAPLTVTSLADSGVGTLRAAINYANSNSGGTITFDPTVFAAKQTITLSSGYIGFIAPTTIQGPAVGVVIDGGNTASTSVPNANAIFFVNSVNVTLTNLTLQNGYAAVEPITITQSGTYTSAKGEAGGAISIVGSCLVRLTNCTLLNNRASGGGAIYNTSLLYLTNCVLSGNRSYVDQLGFPGSGGGIDNEGGFVSLTGCTLINNSAEVYGGGLYTTDGDVALVNCTLTGNTASYAGGGVCGNTAPLTLTNCVFTGNTAPTGGGLDSDSNSYTYLAGCTFTANSAVADALQPTAQGGGFYSGVFCHTSLTNDIFYGNTAPANAGTDVYLYTDSSGGTGIANVAYCDIGSYTQTQSTHTAFVDGGHNISANPQFKSAPGDLHLQAGSPCLSAGTPAVPANPASTFSNQAASHMDRDGNPRPNPPSIGAYDFNPGHAHLLWNKTDGTASLWTVNPDGTYTSVAYGPFSGWTARATAAAPDGTNWLLWTNTNGTASLWHVTALTATGYTSTQYGPYAGYSAVSLSVGSDGSPHLLWDKTDGTALLWTVNTANGSFTYTSYGPYAGWTANKVASGATVTDLMWTNVNGTAAGWRINNADGTYALHAFGPYPGYTATALSVGSDDGAHLLWDKTDGTALLWSADFNSGAFTYTPYGPFSGYSARAIATGPDNVTHILWNATNGTASLWAVTASGYTYKSYGPFSGWTANALSAGP